MRIYWESLKKWGLKIGIPVGISCFALLFYDLIFINAIIVSGYSGDMVCKGTIEDPCLAFINFTAREDIFIYPIGYDPWGRETPFYTDKGLKSWKMYRSWGTGWREIKLNETCPGTWCGAPNNKGVKYSIVFREDRDYEIKIEALKENPNEDIKWGFGPVDPTWFGSGSKGFSQYKTTGNSYYKLLSRTGNESLYSVSFRDIDETHTTICLEANFETKQIITYKNEELKEVDKNYTYSIPLTLSFYKTTELSKQTDLNKELEKVDVKRLEPYEEGDINKFCYTAKKEKDFDIKFGDKSVIDILEAEDVSTSSV